MNFYNMNNLRHNKFQYEKFVINDVIENEPDNNAKAELLEIKENVFSTILNSSDLDNLHDNFITSRNRIRYAKSVENRIDSNIENLMLESIKKLYNLVYNELNDIR